MERDEFHGQGGTYEVREGKRVLVTPPTQSHPEGDRARDADGKPIDEAPAAAEATPQPDAPLTERNAGRRYAGPDLEPRSDY